MNRRQLQAGARDDGMWDGVAMAAAPRRRLISVSEYHRMGEAGILCEDDRVELLAGVIYEMSPIGSHHAGEINRLSHWFTQNVGDRAVVSVQNPVSLLPYSESEPEPDLALLRPRSDFYTTSHPGPQDILLIIEVADTSLAYDRDVKLLLYAQAGIPEVFLFNLRGRCLEVSRNPGPDGYRETLVLGPGDQVSPLAFPDLVLPLGAFLSAPP
jgi:Uma2 family endonuclease